MKQKHFLLSDKKTFIYKVNILRDLDALRMWGPFILAGLMFIGCVIIEMMPFDFSREQRSQTYSILGTITFYLSIILSILYGHKYGLNWIRSIVYTLASFYIVFSYVSQQWRDIDLKILGAASVASFRSVLLLPVLCFVLSRFDKLDTFTLCDYLTPYYFFQHGITTHACWISGCCEGRTMPWGILNPNTGQTAFPAQPYAILLALGVSLWGLLYAKKRDYKTGGKIFAVSLITYGFFRYVMEFFTDDLRVVGELSLYSLYSLVMILLGMLVYYRRPKIPVEINKSMATNTYKNMEEQV